MNDCNSGASGGQSMQEETTYLKTGLLRTCIRITGYVPITLRPVNS